MSKGEGPGNHHLPQTCLDSILSQGIASHSANAPIYQQAKESESLGSVSSTLNPSRSCFCSQYSASIFLQLSSPLGLAWSPICRYCELLGAIGSYLIFSGQVCRKCKIYRLQGVDERHGNLRGCWHGHITDTTRLSEQEKIDEAIEDKAE